MSLDNVINEDRKLDSIYHYNSAKTWMELGENKKLHTPLVYAAFEFRCSIERIVLELFILMQFENITNENIENIKNFKSLVQLVHELAGGSKRSLAKVLTFNSIVSEFSGLQLTLSIPDVGKLQNFWHKLSKYCHCQLTPENSWDSDEWVQAGYVLLNQVSLYIKELIIDHFFGSFSTEGMHPLRILKFAI